MGANERLGWLSGLKAATGAAARRRRVARIEPAITSTNPTAMPTVKFSRSTVTPSNAATAGLMYVMTVARTGPIAAIRAKNRTNASAVQTIASTATDSIAPTGGTDCGHFSAAHG